MEEAPHAPPVGAGAAPPPNPPPRPANGPDRFPNTLGQVGEQYGPSIAPFARARCPFSPLLRPHSPGGAARGSHTGQFSCFGPRSFFIAFVLDIPNGLQTLDRAVGRAYIRERIPTCPLSATNRHCWRSSEPVLMQRPSGERKRRGAALAPLGFVRCGLLFAPSSSMITQITRGVNCIRHHHTWSSDHVQALRHWLSLPPQLLTACGGSTAASLHRLPLSATFHRRRTF
jgi:hypothetical protein